MGGVILLFMLAVLVTILVTPALRARGRVRDEEPPPPPADDVQTHEVVVPQLDDMRNDPAKKDQRRS